MNLAPSRIGLRRREDFVVALGGLAAFGTLFNSYHPTAPVFLSWVLLTAGLSMMMLNAIGYFDPHTPKPRMTGVLSLWLALPAAALFSKWLVLLVTGTAPLRSWEALRAAVWAACLFEASRWAVFRVHRALGRRWTLAAYLDANELKALSAEVERADASWWVNILPATWNGDGAAQLPEQATIVLSAKSAGDLRHHPELVLAHLRGQRIIDVVQLVKELRGRVDLAHADAWTFLLGSTYQSFPIRLYFHVKELLEPVLAAALIAMFAPLWLLLPLAIRLTSGGPVVYRQARVGYRGRVFPLLKFRTMRASAEAAGPRWASTDDPRVTPLGRWLRKSRMDELPQLVNVLRGEMSFVGPRPERPEFYQMLDGRIPLFHLRLMVRPGITGWAQVRQGYAASVEESKTKLEYDLFYIQRMSPGLDMRVLVSTAALILGGGGGR